MKDTNFDLESEASFIHISRITSFKPFLIAWLREYCTFLDSSEVSLKSSPWSKYTSYGTILQNKIDMFYYQTFFLLHICSLLDCSEKKKNRNKQGSPSSFNRKEAFISLSSLVIETKFKPILRADFSEGGGGIEAEDFLK